MIIVLRAIEGARSAPTTVDPLWTMPGHLAQHGRLTHSVTYLVDSARHSVVCSTFNFQRSSGLWKALRQAAQRPEITMRVYLDTNAADKRQRPWSPTTTEVAAHLRPATVLRTRAVRRTSDAQPLEVHLRRPPVPARHQRELLMERGERQPRTRRAHRQRQPGRGSRARDAPSRRLRLRACPGAGLSLSPGEGA